MRRRGHGLDLGGRQMGGEPAPHRAEIGGRQPGLPRPEADQQHPLYQVARMVTSEPVGQRGVDGGYGADAVVLAAGIPFPKRIGRQVGPAPGEVGALLGRGRRGLAMGGISLEVGPQPAKGKRRPAAGGEADRVDPGEVRLRRKIRPGGEPVERGPKVLRPRPVFEDGGSRRRRRGNPRPCPQSPAPLRWSPGRSRTGKAAGNTPGRGELRYPTSGCGREIVIDRVIKAGRASNAGATGAPVGVQP